MAEQLNEEKIAETIRLRVEYEAVIGLESSGEAARRWLNAEDRLDQDEYEEYVRQWQKRKGFL